MKSFFYRIAVISLLFLLAACAQKAPEPEATAAVETEEATLYTRLGGKEAIQAVVNDFVDAVHEDERIKNEIVAERLKAIDVNYLKAQITDFVCKGVGGPCEYNGRNMKEAHMGLAITGEEFDFVVEDLVKTLDKFKVPEKEKNELLAVLGPFKADIVEKE